MNFSLFKYNRYYFYSIYYKIYIRWEIIVARGILNIIFRIPGLKWNRFSRKIISKKISEQQLMQWEKNKNDLPEKKYAKISKLRPKLLPAVLETLSQVGQISKGSERGISFPVHYIFSMKGYYEGEWKAGKPFGYGKFYFNKGMYFQGEVRHGDAIGGDCLIVYPDGSYKKGDMFNGVMQGYGIYINRPNNMKYNGYWVLDRPDGEGTQTHNDGTVYQGKFINGKKQDEKGELLWPNGKKYIGDFKQGFMQGHGRLYMENGKGQYQGQFKRNMKIGKEINEELKEDKIQVKIKTQTGQYYGPLKNGEMHGYGQFKWYDDKVYIGQFRNGQMHGNGILKFDNNHNVKVKWINGQNVWMELQQ